MVNLLKYDVETIHQPGARHAPYYFVSGYLFSKDILNVYGQIRRPVWMVHGIRGDFVDYHLKERVAHRPNWIIVMPTGAFPHLKIGTAGGILRRFRFSIALGTEEQKKGRAL